MENGIGSQAARSGRDLELEELNAGESLAGYKASFGIVEHQAIDTALRRLHAWALAATSGTNMVRIGETLYSWDTKPRQLKNHAVEGRVHAQRRGQMSRDIGGYKIAADGEVVKIPAPLAGVLPGADRALEQDEPQPTEES